jgi:lipid-A-disaccharide synthase
LHSGVRIHIRAEVIPGSDPTVADPAVSVDKARQICYKGTMKFFVITGEASGDMHASFVIREIKRRVPESEFFGVGGRKMRKEGVRILFPLEHLAIIGFWEVVRKISSARRILRSLVKSMKALKPDALLLIDSPGFNLRLAPFARDLGIKVFYYITPQVWAWGGWRLRAMYRDIDHALVIFPFEEKLLSSYGIETTFVGHPLVDEMEPVIDKVEFCKKHRLDPAYPIIALLPGSRDGEIKRILPIMLDVAKEIRRMESGVQFILPSISRVIEGLLPKDAGIAVVYDETSSGINAADAAIAASGTVTLETALLGTPSVVVYRVSALTYLIVKLLIKLPYIGLINIVRRKRIVPEYIQYSIHIPSIAKDIVRFIKEPQYASRIMKELRHVREMLGGRGASGRAADIILERVRRGRKEERE